MKKLFKTLGICSLALPACLALAGGSASAASVSGSTNLTVTVPPFITLYYPTALKLTLADAGSSAIATTADVTGTEAAGVINAATLDVSSAANPYTATKSLTINDVWAVRGLTASGSVTVAITQTAITLTNGTKTISIPAAGLKVADAVTTAGAASITSALTGMTPAKGNIKMTLDMSTLNTAGAISGAYTLNSAYTITVTGT